MKETDKMSRAIGQIEKMFRSINRDFFNGELETPIFTVQKSGGKSYGHSTCKRVWNNKKNGTSQYEINIAADFLNCEIECTLDTLIHECIHLYCRQKDIKETSRGAVYHNKKFRELAEKCGLKVYYTERAGWNTDHRGNYKLTEYALNNNFFDINIGTGTTNIFNFFLPNMGENQQQHQEQQTETQNSSTIKYKCPKCGTKIRGTKNLDGKIKCIDCDTIFIRF